MDVQGTGDGPVFGHGVGSEWNGCDRKLVEEEKEGATPAFRGALGRHPQGGRRVAG